MTRPIAISLSPNTEADDIRLARTVLLRPATWRDISPVQQTTAQLEKLFPAHQAILLTSGRAALYRLLIALNIGSGDEVIIQAFTCSVVPAAIQWAGAAPVYADINKTDFNLDLGNVARKITPHTRAIIVQHTFGIPVNIAALQKVAQEHKLIIIEDCAHALGSRYNNKPLGTLGDVAFFSFGRDKMLSSVFGGAILSRDEALVKSIATQIEHLPAAPLLWIKQQLLHPLIVNSLLLAYFNHSVGKIGLVTAQRLHILSKVLTPNEKKGQQPLHLHYRFPGALAELLQHQLEKLSRFTTRRQEIAARYQQALANNPRLALPTLSANSQPAWLRYPILVENPIKLHQQAKQHYMLLGDWYDTPLAPRDVEPCVLGYNPGSCPNAETVAKHVINLPTYPLLTDQQVEQIITFIQNNA